MSRDDAAVPYRTASARATDWSFCRIVERYGKSASYAVLYPLGTVVEFVGNVYFFSLGFLNAALGAVYGTIDLWCRNSCMTPSVAITQSVLAVSNASRSTAVPALEDIEAQNACSSLNDVSSETENESPESPACNLSMLGRESELQLASKVGEGDCRSRSRDSWALAYRMYDSSRSYALKFVPICDQDSSSSWVIEIPSTDILCSSNTDMCVRTGSYSNVSFEIMKDERIFTRSFFVNMSLVSNKSSLTLVNMLQTMLKAVVHYFLASLNVPCDFLCDGSILPYLQVATQLSLPWDGAVMMGLLQGKVETGGIHSPVVSAKENVIFIHGASSSSKFWRDTILSHLSQEFLASHTLFLPDLLGSGDSPRPQGCSYSIDIQVEALHRSVIASNGLEKYHLVAHSMGCMVALTLAAANPDAVQSITLLSPANWQLCGEDSLLQLLAPRKLLPPHTIFFSSTWHYPYVARLVASLSHPFFSRPLMRSLLPERYPTSLIEDLVTSAQSFDSSWAILENCLRSHRIGPALETLHRVQQRVRIIHGMADPLCPFECSVELAELYSNVSLLGVPGGPHELVVGRERAMAHEIEKEATRIQRMEYAELPRLPRRLAISNGGSIDYESDVDSPVPISYACKAMDVYH